MTTACRRGAPAPPVGCCAQATCHSGPSFVSVSQALSASEKALRHAPSKASSSPPAGSSAVSRSTLSAMSRRDSAGSMGEKVSGSKSELSRMFGFGLSASSGPVPVTRARSSGCFAAQSASASTICARDTAGPSRMATVACGRSSFWPTVARASTLSKEPSRRQLAVSPRGSPRPRVSATASPPTAFEETDAARCADDRLGSPGRRNAGAPERPAASTSSASRLLRSIVAQALA
mmetsp:Transcript_41127/g.128961  ORF Transcript_41127/g.128961 Transcript_41127/m.128961 type:complete len:234 (-) Transcript_41127:18-719(-)